MSERKRAPSPEQEPIISPNPQWLAGIFEVGGSMRFTISYSKDKYNVYPHAYPLMELGENNLAKLERFQANVGGRIKSIKETSYI